MDGWTDRWAMILVCQPVHEGGTKTYQNDENATVYYSRYISLTTNVNLNIGPTSSNLLYMAFCIKGLGGTW